MSKISETQRLDWMLANQGAQCGYMEGYDRVCFVQTWVCYSEPGNPDLPGGNYIAKGASHRDCIDKFLRGDITRIT